MLATQDKKDRVRDGTIFLVVFLLLSLFSVATAVGQDLVIFTEHSPNAQYLDEELQLNARLPEP